VPNPDHVTFWNNTIIQQTEFSHRKAISSHTEKREVVTLAVGITTLIAVLTGIPYGVVFNNETTQTISKIVEKTSHKIGLNFKDMQRFLSSLKWL
jgi:hypothetical protein